MGTLLGAEGPSPASAFRGEIVLCRTHLLGDDDLPPLFSEKRGRERKPQVADDRGPQFVFLLPGQHPQGAVLFADDTVGELVDVGDVDPVNELVVVVQQHQACPQRLGECRRERGDKDFSSPLRARWRARCRATTVFPVPGPPVIRAGPR